MLAVCTVDTESLLPLLIYIRGLVAAIVIESRDVAQRTERHGTSCREGERFNSAISSDFKEIIDMVGTQNEKTKRFN